jgi:hypothetical protein
MKGTTRRVFSGSVLAWVAICSCPAPRLVGHEDGGPGGPDSGTDAGLDLTHAIFEGTVASWSARPGPIFEGQFPQIPECGDPSLLHDDAGYRMYYTCNSGVGAETCLVLSADGFTWTDAPTKDPYIHGRVLYGQDGAWDAAHETPFALAVDGGTWLYFIGYRDRALGLFGPDPTDIGVALSTDGLNFDPPGAPILQDTDGGYDEHGMSSPSIVEYDGQWVMLYTGWCFNPAHCPRAAESKDVTLLAATSFDGLAWTKAVAPVELDVPLAWAPGGIAETVVTQGPDGYFYLFFTAIDVPHPTQLGLAISASPFGPWSFAPEPILPAGPTGSWNECGPVAPSVLFENGVARMWFAGQQSATDAGCGGSDLFFRIGYAEAPLPLVK